MKFNGTVIDFPKGQPASDEPFEENFTEYEYEFEDLPHEVAKLRYTIECLCCIVGELAKAND